MREHEREAGRSAYSLEQKAGESLATWHKRRARRHRSNRIHISSFSDGRSRPSSPDCGICNFDDRIAAYVTIETDGGKISDYICIDCVKRISELCDKVVEKILRRREKDAQSNQA